MHHGAQPDVIPVGEGRDGDLSMQMSMVMEALTCLSLRELARSCKYRFVYAWMVRASVLVVEMTWVSYSFLTVPAMKHVGNSRGYMDCTSYEGCQECLDIGLG